MGAEKVQTLQSPITFKQAKAVKRALKIILPLSISTLLLSYYSSCLPCLFQSINLSNSTVSLLHDFINRKAMFLFCNAILLFLARDFGSHGSSVLVNEHLHDELVVRPEDKLCSKTNLDETEAHAVEAEEEEAIEESAAEMEAHDVVGVVEGEGMELVVVDEMEEVSAEELNRKFEEFIKKVKRQMLED